MASSAGAGRPLRKWKQSCTKPETLTYQKARFAGSGPFAFPQPHLPRDLSRNPVINGSPHRKRCRSLTICREMPSVLAVEASRTSSGWFAIRSTSGVSLHSKSHAKRECRCRCRWQGMCAVWARTVCSEASTPNVSSGVLALGHSRSGIFASLTQWPECRPV